MRTGDVTKATNAKVAVYSCPFDAMNTETKGTVLIQTADELKSFSKGEEDLIESVSQYIDEKGNSHLSLSLSHTASQSYC